MSVIAINLYCDLLYRVIGLLQYISTGFNRQIVEDVKNEIPNARENEVYRIVCQEMRKIVNSKGRPKAKSLYKLLSSRVLHTYDNNPISFTALICACIRDNVQDLTEFYIKTITQNSKNPHALELVLEGKSDTTVELFMR
jgi:hypothetical protein